MTWGQGYGVPWGGGPLVPVADPLSEVGGDPTSFDFTDAPNGPLPGAWEFYQLTDDGLGGITGAAEPAPATYYRVVDGLGLWAYARAPLVAPFLEQGVAASPSGALEGRNTRASAVFRSPLLLKGQSVDAFRMEIVVGVRLEDEGTTFVGGRVRAEWDTGLGWTTPIEVDAVTASGGPLVSLGVAPLPDVPKPTDLWQTAENHELVVEVRGDSMTVRLGCTAELTVPVPADGPAKALLLARVYDQTGTLIEPVPAFLGFLVQSLYDLERLGPAPQCPGDGKVYEHPTLPTRAILGADLLDATRWKRCGGRRFEAKIDHATSVGPVVTNWNEGDIIRLTDRFCGQYLVPYVLDLAAIRARGSGKP